MSQGPGRRALTWGMVVLLLLNACATVPRDGTGGSGRPEQRGPSPGSSEWDALEEARRAELESALAEMWGVASEVREVGAELDFTFWTEGGAFTLLSLRRRERGGQAGSAVTQESFASNLRDVLTTYAEGAAGELRLTLRREERRWRSDFKKEEEADFPLEAKTWPVRRVGVCAEQLQGLVATGREVASRVWVPAGAQVQWEVEVALDDERVTGLETHPPSSLPGGASVRAAPELVGTWVNVLGPFTQGMGPRKVRMEWEGAHIAGTGKSRWKLLAAEVVRPPPPAPQNAEVALEYRAMHEQILRDWREQTRDSFQAAGIFTVEQLALWFVGEWMARGAFLVTEAAAPTVARVLARGGTEAVGWFRSLLARAAPAERQAFGRLIAKVETQGLEALTGTERVELQALFGRLNELTTARVSPEAKRELRRLAREEFDRAYPNLLEKMRELAEGQIDVHHRIPLDFAYLFPYKDINAISNLAAIESNVHYGINSVWGAYTSRVGARATAAEVEAIEKLIEKNFGRWYSNAQMAPTSSEMVGRATQNTLQEMKALLERAGK